MATLISLLPKHRTVEDSLFVKQEKLFEEQIFVAFDTLPHSPGYHEHVCNFCESLHGRARAGENTFKNSNTKDARIAAAFWLRLPPERDGRVISLMKKIEYHCCANPGNRH